MYGRGRFFRGGRGNFRGGFQQNARWGAQGTVKAQNLQVLSKAQKNKERYVKKTSSEDYKGPFLYYVRVGGPENVNFALCYVVKMSLHRWVGGSKTPQRNIKMAPKEL
mgnify:CR=1 FL=1